ncbi:hypothetical protein GCM10009786_04430 [Leucobacter alluvii]|uniref:Uncharacterized protein n=1 Tax=Leucobacter alluvii TaxID=340321 RepID=A0ABN3B3X3_9MICO
MVAVPRMTTVPLVGPVSVVPSIGAVRTVRHRVGMCMVRGARCRGIGHIRMGMMRHLMMGLVLRGCVGLVMSVGVFNAVVVRVTHGSILLEIVTLNRGVW